MISFFRNIRKKLVAEGHLSKYFWYAIGEIILVMIGILLALQVNNWNEDRIALNDTKNYLTKKLNNLNEDKVLLQELRDYRMELHEMCKAFLDKGYDEASDYEIVTIGLIATIERRFASAINNTQRGTLTSYYKNIEKTDIEQLENDYLKLVDLITFAESRLNISSEDLESDLWRTGFFTDNRALFINKGLIPEEDYLSGKVPALIRKPTYAIDSLMALIRRNEISSLRLSGQYEELMVLNERLQAEVKTFLSGSEHR